MQGIERTGRCTTTRRCRFVGRQAPLSPSKPFLSFNQRDMALYVCSARFCAPGLPMDGRLYYTITVHLGTGRVGKTRDLSRPHRLPLVVLWGEHERRNRSSQKSKHHREVQPGWTCHKRQRTLFTYATGGSRVRDRRTLYREVLCTS